ncbi:MAG: hypothetical protein HZC49_02830 [Nitrospirae bacterium]|nr:hypothetical protein [Nitrospirota bacterium]
MKRKHKIIITFLTVLSALILIDGSRHNSIFTSFAFAHCDTLAGPVVMTAKTALEKSDITPLLKWVKKENEKEIRDAFAKTLAVRKQSKDAKELADMYFFETLVRIHRAGEGAPYTGLKPGEAIEPVVQEADKALEAGSADHLVKFVTDAVAKGIREKFAHAKETKKHADDSVAAGREFVEAYVIFTHYVERLHLDAEGAGLHGEEAAKPGAGQHGH